MQNLTLKRSKVQKQNIPKKKKGKFMETVSKMSRGFMIPIAILPFAGMLLGIGGSITGYPDLQVNNYALWTFGNVISVGGDMIFSNLPLLFSIALAITFTNDAGGAGLAAAVGYIVFNAFQSAFIDGDSILWFIKAPDGFIDKNLGITSMATSVFGGITIGALAAWTYNRFSTKQMPGILNFFSGNRLVPIMMFIIVFPVAILFLLVWPWIGKALSWFGTNSAKAPAGLDSFFYGFGERTLLPFGLHHVFYLPLWQTSAGGSLALTDHATSTGDLIINGNTVHVIKGTTSWSDVLATRTGGVAHTAWDVANGGHSVIQGDQNLWQAAHGSGVNFIGLQDRFGVNVGRFQQNYPIYLGALPAACFAMWWCADSKNKKQAAALLGTAAGTSFVTGITEPVEYTFLFIAPALFWGFHNIMSGFSAMLLNVTGAHIGVTFSSGFIDLIIYGIVPVMQGTNFWWALVFSAAYAPIYFIVFMFVIKKFDLQTPGRGEMTTMLSKTDFKNKKSGKHSKAENEAIYIVGALGGTKNIRNMTACATRLRVDINDAKLISEEKLKLVGAVGIVWTNDHHIQAIYGGQAEVYSNIFNQGKIDFDTEIEGEPAIERKEVKQTKLTKQVKAIAPLSGTVTDINTVPDDVFAQKMMGDGAVIKVSKTVRKADLVSPLAGEVVTVFPTGHAFGIKTKEGVELLIHIGLDTVKLDGDGFTPMVKQGDEVKVGDTLVNVNFELIRKKIDYVNPIFVVTSGQKVEYTKGAIKAKAVFLTIS